MADMAEIRRKLAEFNERRNHVRRVIEDYITYLSEGGFNTTPRDVVRSLAGVHDLSLEKVQAIKECERSFLASQKRMDAELETHMKKWEELKAILVEFLQEYGKD